MQHHNTLLHTLFKDNELNITACSKILWNHKWTIFFITFLSLITALAYIKHQRPLYEAKAIVVPASVSEISQFNLGRSINKYDLLPPFKRYELYAIFYENLESRVTKEAFLNLLDIQTGLVDKQNFAKHFVTIRDTNAQTAVQLVKNYIEMANQLALNELVTIIKTQNETLVRDLHARIQAAQKILHEQNVTKEQSRLETKRIRDMKENYEVYNGLKILHSADLYRLDGAITASDNPVWPHKGKIVFLSLVLGLFLGSGAAILQAFFTERKIGLKCT